MKKSRALLFPLVLLIATCIRVDSHQPTPTPRLAEGNDVTTLAVQYVFIIVETDASGKITAVEPDPAAVKRSQKVEWIALDPDVSIQIEWKNHPGVPRPCPSAARRCGRVNPPPGLSGRVEYGVRAFKNGAQTDFVDPILEVLP